MKYTSSIIQKYGDPENVSKDSKTIQEIESQQGSQLLIDLIAESSGTTANKFKLNKSDRENLIVNLVNSLESALRERI